MSAYDEHNEYDETNGPKQLREALEKANKELKAEREARAAAEAKVSQFSLANILSEKHVPGNIAKWLKRDGVEPTAEAVDKWLEENGADFGWKPGAAQEASEGSTPEEASTQGQPAPQSVFSPEEQAQYEHAQAALSGASGAPGQPLDAYEAAVNQVASQVKTGMQATSVDDVARMLREAGIPIEGTLNL